MKGVILIGIILLFIGTCSSPLTSSEQKAQYYSLKNGQQNFDIIESNMILVGLISDTFTSGSYSSFEMKKVFCIDTTGVEIIDGILIGFETKMGFVGDNFICAFGDVYIDVIRMIMSVEDTYPSNHTIKWNVDLIWGWSEYVSVDYLSWELLNDDGVNVSGTTIFYSGSHVHIGDKIYINVSQPGYYVLNIYDRDGRFIFCQSDRVYYP